MSAAVYILCIHEPTVADHSDLVGKELHLAFKSNLSTDARSLDLMNASKTAKNRRIVPDSR